MVSMSRKLIMQQDMMKGLIRGILKFKFINFELFMTHADVGQCKD